MTSSSDLRRRLQRISPRTPPPATDDARPQPPPAKPRPPSELPHGREVSNSFGAFYLIEERFPLDHPHGSTALSLTLGHTAQLLAEVAGDSSLAAAPLHQLAFLDTETTGLAGGAGTFAFLVGVGAFDGDAFRLRQYFLRTPDEEKAMLAALLDELGASSGLVTFNGKTFDLPLLDSRCVLAMRRRDTLTRRPHLDLLHPARRLWRRQFDSCALSSLERHVLSVSRTQDDVPGMLIPGMYVNYLRTGDASDMRRVIYHNAMDILSMVVLAAHVLDRFSDKGQPLISPTEAIALARWYEAHGRPADAEKAYRKALAGTLPPRDRALALGCLADLLKRAGRRAEAVPLWEQQYALLPDDPAPCIEIAKHYEWDLSDPADSMEWTQQAMLALTHWKPGWRRDEAWADVQHRMERLKRKTGNHPTP